MSTSLLPVILSQFCDGLVSDVGNRNDVKITRERNLVSEALCDTFIFLTVAVVIETGYEKFSKSTVKKRTRIDCFQQIMQSSEPHLLVMYLMGVDKFQCLGVLLAIARYVVLSLQTPVM